MTPAIIFVHGRGQEERKLTEVRDTFVKAFEQAQRSWLGVVIVPANLVGFVWYADIIDPAADRPPTIEPCQYAEDQSPAAELDREDVRDALVAVLTSLHLDGPVLNRFTEDTYKYLSRGEVRCEADARLGLEIRTRGFTMRPLIIVAHSMGGIVSFAAIRRDAESLNPAARLNILRFVTIGTQLGERVILRGLLGAYIAPPVPVPNTIHEWFNFRNRGDVLAFNARPSFQATDTRRIPQDVIIDAGNPRHSAATYLSERHVVQAILLPWCRAHSGLDKPARCSIVEGSNRP